MPYYPPWLVSGVSQPCGISILDVLAAVINVMLQAAAYAQAVVVLLLPVALANLLTCSPATESDGEMVDLIDQMDIRHRECGILSGQAVKAAWLQHQA